MSDVGATYLLYNYLHEDEAQIMALSFKVVGPDAIEVGKVYASPEYANPSRVFTRQEARNLWKKKISEKYWFPEPRH